MISQAAYEGMMMRHADQEERIKALEAALLPFAEAYRYTQHMGPALRQSFMDAMCTGGKCTPQDFARAAELVRDRDQK